MVSLYQVADLHASANKSVYEHQQAATWRGVPMDKCAQDVMVYQELLYAWRPQVIIETGSWAGGSGLFFADMCYLYGRGKVLSVDVNPPSPPPAHPLLTFLGGDSVDVETVRRVKAWADGRTGFVVLDSAHEKAHVLAELDAYSQFVGVGDYLIVEDTNINGHPVRPELGPGPAEAVAEWLARTPEFVVDSQVEPYITFAPGGYLRRIA